MLTSASPARSDGAGAELKRGMGSSTKDRKFRSTDRGGACSRSRSAAAAAATERSSEFGRVRHLAAVTRAREASRFPGALRRTDLLEPPVGAAAAGDVAIFFLAKLLLADSGSGPTMELRRSMLTSASPARSDGAGAETKARYGVIDNRSEIPQH